MKKIIETLASITVCMVLIMTIVFWFWYLYPYKIADIKSPATVITKQIKRGDILYYKFEGEVFGHYNVIEIRRKLVDGYSLPLDTIYPITPMPEKINHINAVQIPDKIFLGTYTVQFEAIHRVNPIRTESVFWETEKFEVIE